MSKKFSMNEKGFYYTSVEIGDTGMFVTKMLDERQAQCQELRGDWGVFDDFYKANVRTQYFNERYSYKSHPVYIRTGEMPLSRKTHGWKEWNAELMGRYEKALIDHGEKELLAKLYKQIEDGEIEDWREPAHSPNI